MFYRNVCSNVKYILRIISVKKIIRTFSSSTNIGVNYNYDIYYTTSNNNIM